LAAFRSALQVRTRDRLPQDWAATENNLGVALAVLGKMSKGPQATGYLEEAVGTFRNALQVRTRDQLPQGWAATQNNLGASLHDLAVRSEGPQAAAYMEQAVAAFRNALQVRTEANFPGQWLLTMINLAHTYEISRDWNNARESYERLLHHDPNNAYFQEKFRELEEKH
jgi:tetratricopeptide (TPR) repeat protein